ncbi:MAG: aromatic amino acid exporter YddG [Methyloligellaceae bacterium]
MVLGRLNSGRQLATFIGFLAILMWSFLAVFTEGSGTVPPFQLTAMSLTVGGIIGVIAQLYKRAPVLQPVSPTVLGLGIFGLFGFHFFYFSALRNAPAIEAGLISYLWPILIILFSALLPGERLRWFHIAGGALGLSGAVLIVSKGGQIAFQAEYGFGYIMALLSALTWSSYSVLSRRAAHVPTHVITVFCLISAMLSGICHLMLETTVVPANLLQWVSVLFLGLGPVGLAFYVWDYGVKHGNIQVLGALSYLAPLFSTALLILTGFAELSSVVLIAGVMITGGAVLGSRDVFLKS